MPWLIHGFRGNVELADQLLTKGMSFRSGSSLYSGLSPAIFWDIYRQTGYFWKQTEQMSISDQSIIKYQLILTCLLMNWKSIILKNFNNVWLGWPRTELILDDEKLKRLRKANVLVVGLGGVGAICCRADLQGRSRIDDNCGWVIIFIPPTGTGNCRHWKYRRYGQSRSNGTKDSGY